MVSAGCYIKGSCDLTVHDGYYTCCLALLAWCCTDSETGSPGNNSSSSSSSSFSSYPFHKDTWLCPDAAGSPGNDSYSSSSSSPSFSSSSYGSPTPSIRIPGSPALMLHWFRDWFTCPPLLPLPSLPPIPFTPPPPLLPPSPSKMLPSPALMHWFLDFFTWNQLPSSFFSFSSSSSSPSDLSQILKVQDQF